MKILPLLLLITISGVAQKKTYGYGSLGYTAFVSSKYPKMNGVLLNAGVCPDKHTGLGIALEAYTFSNSKPKYLQASVDMRLFISGIDKKASPYVAFQPGWTFYNDTRYPDTKGSFAANALFGVIGKIGKKVGCFFSIGYGSISFSENRSSRTSYGGAKLNAGIAF